MLAVVVRQEVQRPRAARRSSRSTMPTASSTRRERDEQPQTIRCACSSNAGARNAHSLPEDTGSASDEAGVEARPHRGHERLARRERRQLAVPVRAAACVSQSISVAWKTYATTNPTSDRAEADEEARAAARSRCSTSVASSPCPRRRGRRIDAWGVRRRCRARAAARARSCPASPPAARRAGSGLVRDLVLLLPRDRVLELAHPACRATDRSPAAASLRRAGGRRRSRMMISGALMFGMRRTRSSVLGVLRSRARAFTYGQETARGAGRGRHRRLCRAGPRDRARWRRAAERGWSSRRGVTRRSTTRARDRGARRRGGRGRGRRRVVRRRATGSSSRPSTRFGRIDTFCANAMVTVYRARRATSSRTSSGACST